MASKSQPHNHGHQRNILLFAQQRLCNDLFYIIIGNLINLLLHYHQFSFLFFTVVYIQ